jgi:molecular chaperone GrpE
MVYSPALGISMVFDFMSKTASKQTTPDPSSPEAAPTPPAAPPPAEPAATAPAGDGETESLSARAAKADEHWERLVRVSADFDNYRKRAAREKHEAIKFANESLITKLIPVLDSFDAALAGAPASSDAAADALRAGLALVQQQFKAVLAEAGVEEVDATGQAFDPTWHEAVSQQDSADVLEGHVLQQLRKGYKLRDRLLRPATVIVARKPAAA